MKTAKWWRSRHIDSWAREAKFYWKLSTHYLDLANLSQQDFNFVNFRDFQGTDKTKSNIKFELQAFKWKFKLNKMSWCTMALQYSCTFVIWTKSSIFKLINWSKVIFFQEFPSPPKELGFIFASLQKANLWPIYILIPRKCILESCKRLKPLNFPSGKCLLGKCKNFSF